MIRNAAWKCRMASGIRPGIPDNAIRGVVLAGTGRAPEATSQFEAALRIDPNSAEAHVNLGIALSGIPGRMPEAVRHFEAALRIKPDPEIQQMVDRLEKRR